MESLRHSGFSFTARRGASACPWRTNAPARQVVLSPVALRFQGGDAPPQLVRHRHLLAASIMERHYRALPLGGHVAESLANDAVLQREAILAQRSQPRR